MHGLDYYDDYHWLQNVENEEVHKYLIAERGYMAATLASVHNTQRSILQVAPSLTHSLSLCCVCVCSEGMEFICRN